MLTFIFAFIGAFPGRAAGSAVEPVNPESLCERFLKPAEQANCLKRAKSMDLDWYAVSICDKIEDDDTLLDCWSKINGRTYSPASLASCAGDDLKDQDRIGCLIKTGSGASGRAPASGAAPPAKPAYQPLKIGK